MHKTVQELATYLGAEIVGNQHLTVSGVAETENAKADDLVFISDRKFFSKLENTKSQIIIVSEKFETAKTLLIVKNPKLAFAKVLELVKRPEELKPGIDTRSWIEKGAEVHPTSMIYPFVTVRKGAKVGERVILYPGVYVGQDVVIEEDCVLYPQATIFPGTKIGKRVIVHAGAVVGDDGFGYVWDGEKHYKVPQVGNVVIENDVEVGSNTCIDRGAIDETRVGEGTKIDNLVQVGHNGKIGKHCILCGQVGLAGSVTIGEGAILGGKTGVADYVNIGALAQIGGGAVVLTKIEPNSKNLGYPAMDIKNFFKLFRLWKKLPEIYNTLKKHEAEICELKKRRES